MSRATASGVLRGLADAIRDWEAYEGTPADAAIALTDQVVALVDGDGETWTEDAAHLDKLADDLDMRLEASKPAATAQHGCVSGMPQQGAPARVAGVCAPGVPMTPKDRALAAAVCASLLAEWRDGGYAEDAGVHFAHEHDALVGALGWSRAHATMGSLTRAVERLRLSLLEEPAPPVDLAALAESAVRALVEGDEGTMAQALGDVVQAHIRQTRGAGC